MYGYDIKLSDEPGDVLHLDASEPLTSAELEALRDFWRTARFKRMVKPREDNK